MAYLALLAVFALFTLFDALITVLGLRVGCIELNPVVRAWGVSFWVIFRVILLGSMLMAFIFSHRFLLKHFPAWTRILETTLLVLDFFIAAVVFSGLSVIYLQLSL